MKRKCVDELVDLTDTQLAKKFLIKKGKQPITEDSIRDEIKRLMKVKAGSKLKYPKLALLDARELAFLSESMYRKFEVLARDPEKFELNIEAYVALYEKMIEENWKEMESARSERAKQDLKSEEELLRTTEINAKIINLITKLVTSIDLAKVETSSIVGL